MPMPITPLRKNHPVLTLANPRPTVWAKSPSNTIPTTSRPRFARIVPSPRTAWLAQVALSAKKIAARNEANIRVE